MPGWTRKCVDDLLLCRGPCGRWLAPSCFTRLSNPMSRCGLRSECRECSRLRRQRDRLKAKAGAACRC